MIQNEVRWHAAVRGRVQKVGFRWFVMKNAQRLGLAGWVRNNPDGTVELEAGGAAAAIEELKQRVGQGPSVSRVDHVYDLPLSSDELPSPFEQR
jgi:acylphosphatase